MACARSYPVGFSVNLQDKHSAFDEAFRLAARMTAEDDPLPDTASELQEPVREAATKSPQETAAKDPEQTAAKKPEQTAAKDPEQPLSKNQQKRLAKKERFAANKAAMKLAEKAAKHADTAKRRGEVQQKFAAMTEEERDQWRSARQSKRQNRRSEAENKKSRLQEAMQDGQGVVIDLDFDEHMTESELKSLCGQLQYSYSSNTRAAVPCHLYFTSMQGAVAEQASKQLSGLENWHVTRQPQSYIEAFQNRKPDLVYLTADSPNKLCELDNSKLYIIGGIVDRNRHKNICFRKAESQGIQTARLPIDAYIKLASSKVLTVNHVVEILLAWLDCKDWKDAFFKVIPTRKRAAGSVQLPDADQDPLKTSAEGSLEGHAGPSEVNQPSADALSAITPDYGRGGIGDVEQPQISQVVGSATIDQPHSLQVDAPALSQHLTKPSEKRAKLQHHKE